MKLQYKQSIWRRVAIVYLCTLVYIVFFARRRRGLVLFQHRELNIVPLRDKWLYFKSWSTLHPQIKYVVIENIIGNIFLFIPLSFFLFFLFNLQKFKSNISFCFLASFVIELIQFITGKGVADIDDIILNTMGGAIGFLLAKWIKNPKSNLHIAAVRKPPAY